MPRKAIARKHRKMSPLTLLQLLLHHTLLSHPVLTSILFFLLPIFLSFTLSSSKKSRLPPCPPKLPILGNLYQIGPLPHRSFHLLSKKYGPIMLLQLGQAPTLVVSTPELAREILKEQDHKFATRPSLTFPRKFLAGRDITFAPYGEYWRQVKKISVLHLLSSRRVQAYRTIREELVSIMVDQVSVSSSLGPINVSKVLSTLAKDFMSRVTLGKHASKGMGTDAFGVLLEETSTVLGAFHWNDYVPWLAWVSAITGVDSMVDKVFRDGNKFFKHVIETRSKVLEQEEEKEEGSSSFVDILLSLEKDVNRQFHFDKENINAVVQNLFGAGTDSTSIAMEWMMAELVRNPEAMRKLKEEIRDTVGSRTTVTEDDLINMSYLKAVIKETARLHPPSPLLVPRELMEDTEIQGYHVPKGTRAFANMWTICRDPQVWDSPDEFRPERFGGHDPIDFMGNHFELLPFGAGRRMCPAIKFVVPIIELAVANLMHQFDWKLPNAMGEGEMDMMEAPGVTFRKNVKLQLLATPCFCK